MTMKAIKHNQRGFSLFMVMVMMIVIALLVVVTSQGTATESRLSANEADRKYALNQAELGLRTAEDTLNTIYNQIKESKITSPISFDEKCTGGYCTPVEKIENTSDAYFKVEGSPTKAAWERDVFSKNTTSLGTGEYRYIIEYMGKRNNSAGGTNYYFRVTSRATGQNKQTSVTLQSYVEMTVSS